MVSGLQEWVARVRRRAAASPNSSQFRGSRQPSAASRWIVAYFRTVTSSEASPSDATRSVVS